MSDQVECRRPRVVIVGAGVSGLTVAKCLTETYKGDLDLTIVADRFSPDTTSDQAGADMLGGFGWFNDRERKDWTVTTIRYFEQLYDSLDPASREKLGLRKIYGYRFFRKLTPANLWAFQEFPQYFRQLTVGEAKALGPQYDGFVIFDCMSILVKGTLYMHWLMDNLRAKGALFVKRKIDSLSELSGYDVIINCTGIKSYELIGDKSVYPIRGHSVVVRAPSIKQFHTNADADATKFLYIFPHKDHVILGGIAQPNEWSTVRDPETDRDIIRRCSEFEPCLKDAEVIGGWACLRPARVPVRVEAEDPCATPAVVHNYGHGGSGFVLSWGCAVDTVRLVKQCLREKGFTAPEHRSKL